MSSFGEGSRGTTDAPGHGSKERFSNFTTIFFSQFFFSHKFLAKGSPDRCRPGPRIQPLAEKQTRTRGVDGRGSRRSLRSGPVRPFSVG